jgi:hypothetical protein
MRYITFNNATLDFSHEYVGIHFNRLPGHPEARDFLLNPGAQRILPQAYN